MATSFQVLAEPIRRRLLDLLLDGPRPVGELTSRLGLSQPSTSKHLRTLREAGLVRVRKDAQQRWYELCPEPLAEIDDWLAPYRRLWAASLDALETRLAAMPDDTGPDDAGPDDAGPDDAGPDDTGPDGTGRERTSS